MDIGLPAILLGGLTHQGGTGVAPSRCAETKSANQFTPVSADNNAADNGSEATTTDNNLSNTKNKPINQQIQEFCQANCGPQSTESEKQEGSPIEPVQPEVMQDWLTKYMQMANFGPSGTGCVVEPAENRTTAGSALTSELVLTIDSENQTAGETILSSVFAMPVVANCPVGEGENCDVVQISGKTVVLQKYLANQVIAEKAAAEILPDGSKTAADDDLSTIADKSAISGNQKTPVNTSLLASIDKSATLVEKTTYNKADTGQQAVLNSPELSESLRDKDKGRAANNVLNDSLLKKLNSEQIISINKTKDNGSSSTTNSNFEGNSPKTFKQMLSVNSAQYSVTEQSSAAASASKMANTASQSDVSTNVGKQIQESIHSSLKQGEQQITIRLDPPELGKVSIKFYEQDGQIVGLLEVSKAQTKTEIQQALPQIIQNLAENGVQVKRLEVLLTNQQEQQSFKDPSLATGADGWSGQGQASANSDSQGNNPSWVGANEWLTNDQSYTSFIEPGVQITDSSINMLV